MTAHRPRKRFGQHFLTAPEIIEQIVAAIAPAQSDTIVEIGPGQAALTTPLVESGATVHAIELDRDLAASLRSHFATAPNFELHAADALDVDFTTFGASIRVVGNLPYNISTPLMFHLLDAAASIRDAHFMLQKEVVDRLAAAPGSKDYGRLTVMLGCRMQTEPLFDVPPSAFTPPPRVTSAVIRLSPLPPGSFDIADPLLFERLVRQAFSQRRKTLRNALRGEADAAVLTSAGIDPALRPERLAVGDWVRLANALHGAK